MTLPRQAPETSGSTPRRPISPDPSLTADGKTDVEELWRSRATACNVLVSYVKGGTCKPLGFTIDEVQALLAEMTSMISEWKLPDWMDKLDSVPRRKLTLFFACVEKDLEKNYRTDEDEIRKAIQATDYSWPSVRKAPTFSCSDPPSLLLRKNTF